MLLILTQPPPTHPNTTQQYSTPPIENKPKNDFLGLSKPTSLDSQLIKAGWNANAAHAVVALNNEWFTILKQDNPSSLIGRLIQRGLIGSQALFIFPRDNPGAQVYDRWISELLDNALAQPDDKLSSVINLLFEQGESIRAKMIDDAQFRHAFRNDLWPKFIRVIHKTQQPFELYLSEPHLWAFLALPQGERLLEQWPWFLSQEQLNNLTPAAVLFGDDAYPEPLHPLIIEAILENDANTLISLLYFGHEPLFVRLMQRDLSDDLKQVVFSRLGQTPNYTALLDKT